MKLLQYLKECAWLRSPLLTRDQPALVKPVFTVSSALILGPKQLLQLTCAALSIWNWVWALSSSSSFCSLLHFPLHCRRASWALVFNSSLVFWLSWSKASFSFLSIWSLLWKKCNLQTLQQLNQAVVKYWPVGLQHRPSTLPAFAAPAPSTPGPRTIAGEQNSELNDITGSYSHR